MSFQTVPLAAGHKKEAFSCGKSLLDSYIQRQAKQDVKRKLSVCFVLPDGDLIKGYYTLSSTSIPRSELPTDIIKRLPPSYTDLPATLLGRLAINTSYQGNGLGKLLLMDALERSFQTSLNLASMAVIVDPIDNDAVKFYAKYGFILLPASGKMFLPMTTIAQLF